MASLGALLPGEVTVKLLLSVSYLSPMFLALPLGSPARW
jgi:hypothetical protein